MTAGLIVLGLPLCYTLFAHGQTTLGGARLIGTALARSAFGLLAVRVVMLQLRVFYAMRDAPDADARSTSCMVADEGRAGAAGARSVLLHGGRVACIALNVSTSLSYVVGAVRRSSAADPAARRSSASAPVARTVGRIAWRRLLAGAVAWGGRLVAHLSAGSGRAARRGAACSAGLSASSVSLGARRLRLRIPEIAEHSRGRCGARPRHGAGCEHQSAATGRESQATVRSLRWSTASQFEDMTT